MPRKAQVQRSAEEKFAIVIEGLKSGNIAGDLPQPQPRSYAVLPLEGRRRTSGGSRAGGKKRCGAA